MTSERLRQARVAWEAPRCSVCKLRLFRSQHTGVIYTELNEIHEHEPSEIELARWKSIWRAGDLLTPRDIF